MLGFARLTRATLIVSILQSVPVDRWDRFVTGLKRLGSAAPRRRGGVRRPLLLRRADAGELAQIWLESVAELGGGRALEQR